MPLDTTRTGGEAGHLSDHGALHQFYNEYEQATPLYASATAPATPSPDQMWYDTVNDVTKRWNGSNWVFASRELVHVEKSDANVDVTSTFSLDQTNGVGVSGLAFDINADQQMTIIAKASLLVSGMSATGAEYAIVWIEHTRPDASIAKSSTHWGQISIRNATAWTGTNLMLYPQDRFVLPQGTNAFRIVVARFGTAATLRVNASDYPTGSRAWFRAERMA